MFVVENMGNTEMHVGSSSLGEKHHPRYGEGSPTELECVSHNAHELFWAGVQQGYFNLSGLGHLLDITPFLSVHTWPSL